MKYSFTFDPHKKGVRKILGDLEADIMEVAWLKPTLTVRDVFVELKRNREIAYTTVMTVMTRLAEKGLLNKVKKGNAFVYNASKSKDEFTKSTIKKVITELLTDFSTPAISQFIDSIDDSQPEKMDEFAKIIEEKRKKKNV